MYVFHFSLSKSCITYQRVHNFTAGASTSSAAASTSSSTSLTIDWPSHSSKSGNSGNSGSSQKRSGDDLEASLKKRPKEDQPDPREVQIQCASYALEMLSYGGLRTHVIGALITNTELELLYYDRSLHVMSEQIDFSKEKSCLVAFISCLQRATPSQWGRVSRIIPDSDPLSPVIDKPVAPRSSSRLSALQQAPAPPLAHVKPHPLRGATLKLVLPGDVDVLLRLEELVFVQHALIGRGTCVVRASVIGNCPAAWKGKAIVVKFSFTPKGRTPEGKILRKILRIAKGLPTSKDDNTTEDSDTTEDSNATEGTETTEGTDIAEDGDAKEDYQKPNHTWVTNHLPDVLHHETLESSDGFVQSRLSDYLKLTNASYEDRVLQILVMTELFPVTELKTSEELVKVIRDVFKCESTKQFIRLFD